ncbi:MAG: hypothetical protein WEA09_14695 [Gemmatimonadota bacterium]
MEPLVSGVGIVSGPIWGYTGWPARWRTAMGLLGVVILAGGCYSEPEEGPAVVLSQPEVARILRVEGGLTPWHRLPGYPAPRASITERMEHYQVPGAVVALIRDGHMLWVRGCGGVGTGGRPPVLPGTWFPAGWLAPELLRLRNGVGGGVLDQRNPLPSHLLQDAARGHDAQGAPLPLDPSGTWVTVQGVGRLLHRVWQAAPHLVPEPLVLSREGEAGHIFFLPETGEGAVIFTNGAGGGALGLEILEALAREYGWVRTPSPPTLERIETGSTTAAERYEGSWEIAGSPGSRFHLEYVGQALRMTLEGPLALLPDGPGQAPPPTYYFPLTEGSWLEPRSGSRIRLEAGGESLQLEPGGYLARRAIGSSVIPPPPPGDPPLPGGS